MMKRSFRNQVRLRPVPTDCPFCHHDTKPDYTNPGSITQYITERGKILGRARTGLCNKHQIVLKREMKRARFMALIPYIVRT